MKSIRLGLVVADFNREITSRMEQNAEKTANQLSAKIIKKLHVPGVFEIPFAANKLVRDKKIDAVVVLGAVIQGETQHDVVIVNAVAPKLIEISLKYSKPLGFGIIGPRVSWKDAEKRAAEYAKRAVEAAVKMIKLDRI